MKQAKFVKAKAEGKSGIQAALIAYDTTSPNVAGAIAAENLQKPNVKEAIDKEMERQGLTLEKIISPVTKALDSTLKIKTRDGEIIDTGMADLEMQLKGHARAVRLMSFGTKKDDGTINNYGQMIIQQDKEKYGI